MFKKILWLNIKDIIFNLNYWWQALVCIFIGNATFLSYSLENENLLLAKLFSTYTAMFIFSLSLNVIEIAAVEKSTSRLEFYLANGVNAKKVCWCYSISSFILGFITTIFISLCFLIRFHNLNLFMSKNLIALLSAGLICFCASLLLNTAAFFIKNPLAMRGVVVIIFFAVFFLPQLLIPFLIKNNFPYMQFLSGLILISLALSIILLVAFLIASSKLKNEKIILSK